LKSDQRQKGKGAGEIECQPITPGSIEKEERKTALKLRG